MRVAIAEDEPVYRAGLVKFMQTAGFEVSHEAGSGDELLIYLARGELPDMAVLDIRMAGDSENGLRTAEEISARYPQVGLLMLSAYDDIAYAERLFAGGSAGKGYMLKGTLNSVSHLQEALDRLNRKQTYCDPKIVDELISRKRGIRIRTVLSPREQQILELVASGASNDAIVAATQSSLGAVESSLGRIYAKLQLPRGSQYTPRVLAVLRWLAATEG